MKVFRLCCLVAPLILASTPAAGQTQLQTQIETLGTSQLLQTALLLSALAVAPALVIGMTSFVRIVIVLAMVRHAFGMPETPPNPVLISLALLLSVFVMGPTLKQMDAQALQPLLKNEISVEVAVERGAAPLRSFMLRQVREQDLEAMYTISKTQLPERPEEVELIHLAPAFMLNELRVAFSIGFVILLPFLVIDLVVASILLALGMMMVPPATISLPVKLLMFVLIDGWGLIIQGVVGGFK